MASCCAEKASPKPPMPMAARQICHFRSIRSATSMPSSGPTGLAMAMMKAYCRLVVTLMPLAISKVGTQAAKP